MRRIFVFGVIFILIFNVSFGYVERDITIRREKTIPFSFLAGEANISKDLSISGLNNVSIEEIYVDNGSVEGRLSGKFIELDFSNGEKSNGNKTVTKTKTIDISELEAEEKILEIEPEEKVYEILSVTGDINSATLKNDGDIEVIIKDEADGIIGYDEDKVTTSQFTVSIDEENRNRNIISDEIILEHDILNSIVPVSGDTSGVQEIITKDNIVKINFNNGTPMANENAINSGYTYCWVDRNENGEFKTYKPNSVYSTDINKITGLGEYLDENDFSEIGMTVTDNLWEDYTGVEIEGKRYVYVYDETKGIPLTLKDEVVKSDYVVVDGQNLNAEKYTVKFQNADVSYVPEGKLYSMGDLVEDTYGWGEVYPNNENESKKTFFNELTGKYETYVKHFKFFYGPKIKKTFGGYYTYPYTATFEYEHYAPIKYYSGEIIYSYQDIEMTSGYLYNGYVKIEYDEIKSVNDYPPTAPINIKYNSLTGLLRWNSGSDDYTLDKDLVYEIQVLDDKWVTYKTTNKGILEESCPKNYESGKIRIRTMDETGQYSPWNYALDAGIELDGSINPYIVYHGEKVDILANVKSFSKIEKVTAENDEIRMYTELHKVNESSPNFYEMSYDLEADFPEYQDDYIVVSNGVDALGNKDELETCNFRVSDEFDGNFVEVEAVEDIKLNKKSGTIIYSNQNYLNTPQNMFYYNNKYWFLAWDNEIKFFNKVTNEEERLFLVESYAKLTAVGKKYIYVPTTRIRVNKFEYDEKGKATYYDVEVDKNLAGKPFAIRWNTDVSGITEFEILFETTVVYNYSVDFQNINKYVDNFFSVESTKRIKKYANSTYGYITPTKGESASWAEIVLGIAKNRNICDFLWLGYKVRNNEYLQESYVQSYNNNPRVRNNYRLLIVDHKLSDISLNRYISMIKSSNISMTSDKNTVWGDDVIQYTSVFEAKDILVPESTKPGKYEILLTAYDVDGNMATTYLTLIVEGEETKDNENNTETDEEVDKKPSLEEFKIGRFFYRDKLGFLEELSRDNKNSDTEGFLCAGETLGTIIKAKDTEYIEIDFLGDSSIKIFDRLTKKFLVDNPIQNGQSVENVEKNYRNFPIKVYPQYVDKLGNSVFTYFYVVPYGTKESLESWSTLKKSTLKNIDKSKLFDRRISPYGMIIYLNGDRENYIKINFDVFERWDTVLNRNVNSYISNFQDKWEMRIDK